ncbi:MAG TPA: acetyltransferase [Streptosporangiaceae bacterium]|jgi:sugar O-acyltransferase (sialic acid O-acetyltransferase NeuD family)|nr:acetyltransferase [Streptosporangiaceae bacterium]
MKKTQLPRHPLQAQSEAHRVVIVGTGEQAAIAFEYLTYDSPHEVVAFSADAEHLPQGGYCGLPAVPLDQLARDYPPATHRVFVAVSATRLNRLRRRLFDDVRAAGFGCISYVSSQAFVWPSVPIGANSLVFEDCTIQRGASVGDNVILWSGACVAHSSVIEDDCCLAPHAAVAGFSRVGSGSFLGINCCVADTVSIASDCVVGAGAVVIADTKPRQVYVGNPARATGKDSFEAFGVTGSERAASSQRASS